MAPLVRSLIASLLLIAALGSPAAAQKARQLQFGQWTAGSDIVFDYRIADVNGVERRIGFRLAKDSIEDGRAIIQAYSNEDMASAVEAALRDYLRREAPDVEPRFERQGNSVGVKLQGRSEARVKQVIAALDRIYEQGTADYLRTRFMRQIDKTVYLDYARLAERYTPALRPLAQAIAGLGGDERSRLVLALTFFQIIPYDALTDHDVSNGIDFVAPPVLLNLNRGDCDSKAVALGAVLHSLLSHRRLIIVLLPQHAIIGVELPPAAGEQSLIFEGRNYVLMEPAGPATFAPGRLFPDTERHLRARRIDRIMPL